MDSETNMKWTENTLKNGLEDDPAEKVLFVLFPQKRNGIVFSSGVNYLHSEGNIQSE